MKVWGDGTVRKQLTAGKSGQDLVEYAIFFGALGLGSLAALRGLAGSIETIFSAVWNTLASAS